MSRRRSGTGGSGAMRWLELAVTVMTPLVGAGRIVAATGDPGGGRRLPAPLAAPDER